MIEHVAVASLRPNPDNPRTISEERFTALLASLRDDPAMMEARPLMALRDGTVMNGNMRLRAVQRLGWETVPVEFYPEGTTAEDVRRDAVLDNASFGEWDERRLSGLLRELEGEGEDMALTGFTEDELLIHSVDVGGRAAPTFEPGTGDGEGGGLAPADVQLLVGDIGVKLPQAAFYAWEEATRKRVGFSPVDAQFELVRQLGL